MYIVLVWLWLLLCLSWRLVVFCSRLSLVCGGIGIKALMKFLTSFNRLTLFIRKCESFQQTNNNTKHYYYYYISDWLSCGFCSSFALLIWRPFFLISRLMESGLLPAAEAKKGLEKKLQKTGKFSSPTKSAASTQEASPNQQWPRRRKLKNQHLKLCLAKRKEMIRRSGRRILMMMMTNLTMMISWLPESLIKRQEPSSWKFKDSDISFRDLKQSNCVSKLNSVRVLFLVYLTGSFFRCSLSPLVTLVILSKP